MTGTENGAAVLRAVVGEEPLDVAEHAALVEDRKSTRLNSSHR